MQKTYRSKKDANDALDPKEMLYGCEESAFNALYINNIKQTRRELSCFGSSNKNFLPSKKTNKRKYVKRLGRDVKVETRSSAESVSKSTYLTPDKSIHVNKGEDLFDQLINTTISPKKYLTVKKDAFDRLLSNQDPNFNLTPLSKSVIKKINCSTDSDENASNKKNKKIKKKQKKKYTKNIKFKPHNESNINEYDLIVEQDCKKQDYNIDNSIDDLFEKPLLKRENIKNFNDLNDNTPVKLKYTSNRLTMNMISQSPSTSTPVFKKYRSQSIYLYSPIIQEHCTILNATHDMSSENESDNKENNYSNMTKVIIDNKIYSPLHSSSKRESRQYSPILQSCASYSKNVIFNDKNKNQDVKNVENTSIILSNKLCKNQNVSEIHFSSTHDTNIENVNINNKDSNVETSEKICTVNNYLQKNLKVNEKTKKNNEHFSSANTSKKSTLVNLSMSQESFLGFTCNSILLQNSSNNNSVDSCNNQDIQNIISLPSPKHQEELYIKTSLSRYEDESKNISKDLFNSIESINDRSVVFVNVENSNAHSSGNNTYFFDARSNNTGPDKNCSVDLKKQCLNRQPFVQLQKLEVLNILDNNKDIPDSKLLSISLESNASESSDEYKEEAYLQKLCLDKESENKLKFSNEPEIFEAFNSHCDTNLSNESNDISISFVTTRKRNEVTNHSVYFLNNLNFSDHINKTIVSLEDDEVDIYQSDNVNISSNNTVEAINNYNINDSVSNSSKDDDMCSKPNSTNESLSNSKELNLVNKNNKNIYDISFNDGYNKIDKSLSDNETDKDINSNNETNLSSNSSKEQRKIRHEVILSKSLNTTEKKIEPQEHKAYSETYTDNCSRPIILQPGKKWERSLSIYKRMTMANDNLDISLLDDDSVTSKGRKYRQSVIDTMELQDHDSIYKDPKEIVRKSFWPSVSIINLQDSNYSSTSLCKTKYEDISEFIRQDCDDTLAELSKLSIGSSDQDITVIEKESSVRVVTARDYVLQRCEQTDAILFDECYPDTLLKNCHKIGEGVYGEVFLWRAGDGSVRVLKVIPVAGNIKVNGEQQKDFSEIISEIVIAMELSALRTPIAELESHFEDGKDINNLDLHSIENATDVFNEVIGVKCVYGSYPSRLLDLWDLYDECKGSENDNPAILPVDQQFIVLELANAGQDLESYQFPNAEQAYALLIQIAFGLAVGEEAFQFEHRDLHWGNVLISPTDQKWASFVIRGRTHRVRRAGVRATIIDYSLSRLSLAHDALAPSRDGAALYNDLAQDTTLFSAHGDYQFTVYRLMQEKLGNEWKNFEPYTNILWLHYTVDKMITALRYKRVDTKIHKQYINKLKGIKNRILNYESCVDFVLTDNEY